MNDSNAALEQSGTSRIPLFAVCLSVGLVVLRIAYLGFADLFPEEAYYWNYAKHLAIGYLDHPPMVAWLIHCGTWMFGDNEWGVRIGTLLCSLITTFFVYKSALLFYGRREAIFTALLAQLLPFFFMIGFMITPDAPLTACWAGTLYFLARIFFLGSGRSWLSVGLCLGIGMLSKYTIALVGISSLVFLVLDPPSRIWFRRLAPYGSVVLAILVFSPVIFWNYQHHWASFAFQSTGRIAEPSRFSTHELLGAMLVMLTPVGLFAAFRALFLSPNSGGESLASRRRLFFCVYTLVPIAVFLLFSFTHRVKLNWTGPIWLAVLPALGASLAGAAQAGRAWRFAWTTTIILLSLTYLGYLQYLGMGLPGLGYTANLDLFPVGWSQMGQQIDASRKAAENRGGNKKPFFVVGLDRNFIASEAAFYSADRQLSLATTTGSHLFGGRSLMYEYWFPKEAQSGADLLLVSFNRSDLETSSVRRRAEKLGEVEEHWISRDSKQIRPYYTRILFNYSSAKK